MQYLEGLAWRSWAAAWSAVAWDPGGRLIASGRESTAALVHGGGACQGSLHSIPVEGPGLVSSQQVIVSEFVKKFDHIINICRV